MHNDHICMSANACEKTCKGMHGSCSGEMEEATLRKAIIRGPGQTSTRRIYSSIIHVNIN